MYNISDSSLVGANSLTLVGTSQNDTFLVRKGFVALKHDNEDMEYVQFNEIAQLAVYLTKLTIKKKKNEISKINLFDKWRQGNNGDDSFYMDDNSATTILDGGAGNDFFKIGQAYSTLRNSGANLSLDNSFSTTQTSIGYVR